MKENILNEIEEKQDFKYILRREYTIIDITNFENAVRILEQGDCDAICGPRGGVVRMDINRALVFSRNPNLHSGIYFSASDYLKDWSVLRRI